MIKKHFKDCEFYNPESKTWSVTKAELGYWATCINCEHKLNCAVIQTINDLREIKIR